MPSLPHRRRDRCLDSAHVRWTVLLPVKSLAGAKLRLVAASADGHAHARLVEAIRADTLAAARGAARVARVVLVTDGPADAPHVFVQHAPGLNAALAEAAADAAARWPGEGVCALVGDLPALRAADLDAALERAATGPRCFVRDADGTGTTMLTALPGTELRPAFGAGSAARHGAIATELDATARLRRDVDTAADLAAAADLGLGARTAAALADGPEGHRSRSADAEGAGR